MSANMAYLCVFDILVVVAERQPVASRVKPPPEAMDLMQAASARLSKLEALLRHRDTELAAAGSRAGVLEVSCSTLHCIACTARCRKVLIYRP